MNSPSVCVPSAHSWLYCPFMLLTVSDTTLLAGTAMLTAPLSDVPLVLTVKAPEMVTLLATVSPVPPPFMVTALATVRPDELTVRAFEPLTVRPTLFAATLYSPVVVSGPK